jgi:flagellar biosynthetic protein FliR
MILAIDGFVLSVFLVFCRVGACVMQVPGMASARVPARVRLFFALAISVIVTPMLAGLDVIERMATVKLVWVIFAEISIGMTIGLVARIYMTALEFAAAMIANMIGLNGLGTGIEHDEQAAVVTSLVTVTATLILLIGDLHGMLITFLVASYTTLPIGVPSDVASALKLVVETLGVAFLLGLQLSAPFIVYGLLVNLMFGVLGKLVPQIPSYFISVPFLAIGGLVLLYLLFSNMLQVFARAIGAGLMRL